MSSAEVLIRETLERVLRMTETMSFGSVAVHFQVRDSKIAGSRVSQEFTLQAEPEPRPPLVRTRTVYRRKHTD